MNSPVYARQYVDALFQRVRNDEMPRRVWRVAIAQCGVVATFAATDPRAATHASIKPEFEVTQAILDDRAIMAPRSGRRGRDVRLRRAPLWLGRMIQDSRTRDELEALERPLRAWQQHSQYQRLTALFVARIRELAAAPVPDAQSTARTLSTHEARRVTKQIVRAATVPELDAVVERLRIRYTASARRDEVENVARLRRERLVRVSNLGG